MNKSKEKVKENPIVTDRAIRMANPCHRIDKVVPPYWHNPYTNEKSSDNHRLSELFSLDYQDSNLDKQNQNLLCYHYTIVQTYVLSVKKRCKDRTMSRNMQIFRDIFSSGHFPKVVPFHPPHGERNRLTENGTVCLR